MSKDEKEDPLKKKRKRKPSKDSTGDGESGGKMKKKGKKVEKKKVPKKDAPTKLEPDTKGETKGDQKSSDSKPGDAGVNALGALGGLVGLSALSAAGFPGLQGLHQQIQQLQMHGLQGLPALQGLQQQLLGLASLQPAQLAHIAQLAQMQPPQSQSQPQSSQPQSSQPQQPQQPQPQPQQPPQQPQQPPQQPSQGPPQPLSPALLPGVPQAGLPLFPETIIDQDAPPPEDMPESTKVDWGALFPTMGSEKNPSCSPRMSNKLYEALLFRVNQVDNEMWLSESSQLDLPLVCKQKFVNSRRYYQEKNSEKKKKRGRKPKVEEDMKQMEMDYIWCSRFKKCYQYLLGRLLKGESPRSRCFGDEVALWTAIEYVRGLEQEGFCGACADTECSGEPGGECMARLPANPDADQAYDRVIGCATPEHVRQVSVQAVYEFRDISEINPALWHHPDRWLDLFNPPK